MRPDAGDGGDDAGGPTQDEHGDLPSPGAGREAGCIAAFGLLLFPLVVWGFAARFELPLVDALYLATVLELLPFLAVAQVPLAVSGPLDRRGAYLGSGLVLMGLGGMALFLGRDVPGMEGMGLAVPDLTVMARWTGLLLVAAAVLQAGFHGVSRLGGWGESPLLRELLPRTAEEKGAFAGLSLVAGVGEEVAFRGYAIPLLAPVLNGAWPAAFFTSLVFGLLHAYQGPLGMIRTAVFGLVLAASFVITGSLWPAIATHVAVDLVMGLWLGEKMV